MAMSIGRSSSFATQVQLISKNVLYNSTILKLSHMQPACMFSSRVQPKEEANKDELFREIIIEVKGHDTEIIKSYQKFTAMAAKELDVYIARIYEPPRTFTRMSLMKSVFVHKKHFHQYEMRTIFTVFEIKNITGSTANTFLEYIQRNLPEGMAMKVTKHELEKFPEHIKPPSKSKIASSVQEKATEPAKVSNPGTQETAKSVEAISSGHDKLVKYGDTPETSTDVDTGFSEAHASNTDTSLPKSENTNKQE